MQNVTSQWSALFNAAHKTEYRFDIDGVSYLGKDVKDPPVISKPLLDIPAIGRVCTGSLKLTIYPKSQNIPKAATVDAYCRLYNVDGSKLSEWIPQGKFYIYNRSGEKTLTLNCLDRMIKAGTTYIDKSGIHNWPAPMQTVVNEICRIMGVTLDARSAIKSGAPYYVDYPNEDTLISEVLSNIAAAHGGNWIMTEAGQLRLIPLASPASTAVQILGKTHRGYTAKGKIQTISRIILTDGAENEFVSGDETGLTISAKCEYATQAMVNMLCSPFDCAIDNGVLRVTGANYDAAVLDISSATAVSGALSVFSKSAMYGTVYEPYTIDGAYINPAVELGDTVEVTDRDNNVHRVVMQSITMNCTVACTCTLSAGAEGETEDEYPYITQQEMTLSRTVKTNQTYFGNKINRSEGFVSELLVNDVVKARLVANATTFKMSACKDGEWVDGIYFDPVQGRYIITGDVIINGVVTFNDLEQSGSTIINGDNITTGTIKTERIDLSAYSTTEQINALITSSENGILATVNQTITKSMSDLESTIEKEMPKVFTAAPIPPYHVGDLWFGSAGNSYTLSNGRWLEFALSIPPEMCGDVDAGAKGIYFSTLVQGSSIRPAVGEYWYSTDFQRTFKCFATIDENESPWQAIPDTSDIAVFLKAYSQYVNSSGLTLIRLYCATTAPTLPVGGSNSLWYQPGTDIKVCIADNETDTFRASDWQKRDGYADLPMLESLRAEIKIETDRITSTVSEQTTIINEQTGALETLSESVSKIEQTTGSIELSVKTLSGQLDDKVSEGEVCAQIKIETTEGEGVVEIGADRLIVNSTNFKLDRGGTVSATGAFTTFADLYGVYGDFMGYLVTRVSGGQIDFGYSTTQDEFNAIYNMSIVGSAPSYFGQSDPMITMSSGALHFIQPSVFYSSENITFYSGGSISCGGISVAQQSSGLLSLQSNTINFQSPSGFGAVFLYPDTTDPSKLILNGSLSVTGGIYLNGYKGRVVETENYGRRTLAAMESALPVFADMGRGKLDENGFAFIALDDVFSETVEADYQYHVFLSAEMEKTSIYVSQYGYNYFTVSGDPDAVFSWLVFVPQKGYIGDRLPVISRQGINAPFEVDQSIFQTANSATFQSQSAMDRRTESAIANII